MSNVPPWSRSRRKTKIIQSSPLSAREMGRVGVRQRREAKRFGWSSISRNSCGASRLCLGKMKLRARRSSFWSPDGNGSSVKEIVRQQWNFGPPSSIREVEEYRVELSSVAVLELIIKPNISGGAARASLKNLRLS